MVVLRATRKVLRFIPEPHEPGRSSDSALGDWYVDRVTVGRKALLLLVSSKSLLPMLTRARDVRTLPDRLPELVGARLGRLGIPAPLVQAEIAAMAPVHVAKTADRSVLGVMVNYADSVPYYLAPHQMDEQALHFAEAELQRTPWFAGKARSEVVFPEEKTPELLALVWGGGRK